VPSSFIQLITQCVPPDYTKYRPIIQYVSRRDVFISSHSQAYDSSALLKFTFHQTPECEITRQAQSAFETAKGSSGVNLRNKGWHIQKLDTTAHCQRCRILNRPRDDERDWFPAWSSRRTGISLINRPWCVYTRYERQPKIQQKKGARRAAIHNPTGTIKLVWEVYMHMHHDTSC